MAPLGIPDIDSSLGATSENGLKSSVYEGMGQFRQKFQVEEDISPPTILRVRNLG